MLPGSWLLAPGSWQGLVAGPELTRYPPTRQVADSAAGVVGCHVGVRSREYFFACEQMGRLKLPAAAVSSIRSGATPFSTLLRKALNISFLTS